MTTIQLIQLLIPIHDNDGVPFPRDQFDQVRRELTEAFGGVTAFVRSPAQGFWKETGDAVVRDDVVMYEVMTDALDRAWWKRYREQLQQRFRQQEMVVRCSSIERL
jgi:hypothetical protein